MCGREGRCLTVGTPWQGKKWAARVMRVRTNIMSHIIALIFSPCFQLDKFWACAKTGVAEIASATADPSSAMLRICHVISKAVELQRPVHCRGGKGLWDLEAEQKNCQGDCGWHDDEFMVQNMVDSYSLICGNMISWLMNTMLSDWNVKSGNRSG